MNRFIDSTAFRRGRLLAFFLLLVGIFFFRQIRYGEVFYCCDNLLITIPSKVFLAEELRAGRFPLWNPLILSGTPFLADINLGALYPLNTLYLFLPAFGALTWGVMLNVFMGIVGVYLLGKSVKLTSLGSIIAAIVFGFSGTITYYTSNVSLLHVGVLLPWVLWGWVRLIDRPSIKTHLILVVLLTLQIVAGHPQLTFYTWLLGALYIVYRLFFVESDPGIRVQRFMLCGVAALHALALSAVQLLPFLEFAALSTRIGRGFDYASFGSLHPLSLIRLILPNSVGVLSNGTSWAREGSVYGYVGVIGLILALFANRSQPIVRFFLAAVIISFLLALGKYTPVFGIAYTLIPGIGSFRQPQQFLLLYTLSLSMLSGFGAQRMLNNTKIGAHHKVLILSGTVGVVGGVLLWLLRGETVGFIRTLSSFFPSWVFAKLVVFPPGDIQTIITLIASNAMTSGALVVASGLVIRQATRNQRLRNAMLILLIFLELFLFSRNNLITAPAHAVETWVKDGALVHKHLTNFDPKLFRIYVRPNLYPYPKQKKFGDFQIDEESAWQATIGRTNITMLEHLPIIDGYASLIYRSYQDHFRTQSTDPTGVQVGLLDKQDFDLLGVRAIISMNDDWELGKLSFPQVSISSYIALYQNETAWPRIFIAEEGSYHTRGLSIISNTPDDFVVNVTSDKKSTLVYADTNYPGWHAYVDGKKATLVPFEEIFKSVVVDRGSHTVRFTFRPASFIVGGSLSLIAGAIVFAGMFYVFMRKKSMKSILMILKGPTSARRKVRTSHPRLARF